MKVKLAFIYILLIASTFADIAKETDTDNKGVDGIIRGIGWLGWRTVIAALSFVLLNPITIKLVEVGGTLGCSILLYDHWQWKELAQAYVKVVMKNLKAKTFDSEYFCSMSLNICKPRHYQYLDPKNDYKRILSDKPDFIRDNNFINNLYKQIEDDKMVGKERETIKLYHMSDLHWVLDYKEGANNACSNLIWCNEKAGKPKSKDHEAGKWGDYNCDSNPKTLEQMRFSINETGAPDFILWTGDNTNHGISFNPKDTTNTTVQITKFVNKYCSNAVVFPIHGNHEFDPMNLEDLSKKNDPVIKILSKSWSHWLTPEVREEYATKTYYSYDSVTHPNTNEEFKRKMNKTRIISLNSENWYGFNFYLIGEYNDPGQEFEWLENLLRKMEKDGEVAILIGHHPPGNFDCTYPFAARLRALYDRFQHIIRLSLFGHTHYEEFEVVRAIEDNKPIATLHISSSFTPYKNQNPSFRVITLDVETKLPIKIETYTMDLVKANSDDEYAKFFFNHEFAQEYGLSDLSPNSSLDLANKIRNDENTAVKYKVNMLAHGKGSSDIIKKGCSKSWRSMTSCHTSYSVFRDARKCFHWFEFDGFTILSYLFDFIEGLWVIKK